MAYARILLLEDNPADARLLSEYLPRHLPFDLDLVHRRTLAQALFELNRSSLVHLILCDLSTPDSRGAETVAQISAAAPGVPIIVLSGWEDPDEVNAALAAGAIEYFNKANLNGLAFARSLRELLKRRKSELADSSC